MQCPLQSDTAALSCHRDEHTYCDFYAYAYTHSNAYLHIYTYAYPDAYTCPG